MLIGHIEGSTRVLAKDQPEYAQLPILDVATAQGNAMMSAWYPTPEELKSLQNGAPIYLVVMGVVHPPVSIVVGENPL